MSDLELLRSISQELYHQEADLLYRHTATWSDGTTCRFSVQDPNNGKNVRAIVTGPEQASLRILRVHHDDAKPVLAATTPWESGTLLRGHESDVSDFTGQASFSCRQVDGRYYPVSASTGNGAAIQLRIEAASGVAERAGAGAMDVAVVTLVSHIGHVPPGIHLQQGDEITTSLNEKFRVMDPITRDVLGDKVGLSREGTGVW